MNLPSNRIHSHFITTLIHLLSQLVHLGLAIFFTTEWHLITSSCPSIGHALTSVFGGLTAIYAFLSAGKGYALLTHFCGEPWAKRALSILSMVTSSASAIIACGALVLLEIEVSGNIKWCGINSDETPLLPSRIFLVVSVLLNIIFFAISLFLHWKQSRIEESNRDVPSSFISAFSSFPSPSDPSAPPLSNPSSIRLDPSAKLHSPDYFITNYPPKQ